MSAYDVNPNPPPVLHVPNHVGFAGIFNEAGGALDDFRAQKPEHDRHVAAHNRYSLIESRIANAHEVRDMGAEWAAMDQEKKTGLVKAASSLSAISEEAASFKKDLRDLGTKLLEEGCRRIDSSRGVSPLPPPVLFYR